jgi:hypothetical protein
MGGTERVTRSNRQAASGCRYREDETGVSPEGNPEIHDERSERSERWRSVFFSQSVLCLRGASASKSHASGSPSQPPRSKPRELAQFAVRSAPPLRSRQAQPAVILFLSHRISAGASSAGEHSIRPASAPPSKDHHSGVMQILSPQATFMTRRRQQQAGRTLSEGVH